VERYRLNVTEKVGWVYHFFVTKNEPEALRPFILSLIEHGLCSNSQASVALHPVGAEGKSAGFENRPQDMNFRRKSLRQAIKSYQFSQPLKGINSFEYS
jgi:hypothetical protein